MSDAVVGLLEQCPECGGARLIPVSAGEKTNFFCRDCILCWHLERGQASVVDPQTCPGCQLGTTACFERWEVFHPFPSRMTRPGIIGSDASGQEDNDDIESELYCSAREAGVGYFPGAGFPRHVPVRPPGPTGGPVRTPDSGPPSE